MPSLEATDLLASFFAHDPVRTLPKIEAYGPAAVMIAADGEAVHLRPTLNGRPLGGRLMWFLDAEAGIGQISWPKVAARRQPNDHELIARVARLVVHPQIVAYRTATRSPNCWLCDRPITGVSHVDNMRPFVDLLEDWLASVPGGRNTVAAAIVSPADGDPRLTDVNLETAWSRWHEERAELALTHSTCNLRRPRE
jgi:hypothetical protein